ncbi:MAG TPA: 16S rRNA (guanine(966)-N(2))-methyltransferase RsmD [Bdellovibrionota bacterium]|nr:16S rRNA (guanine(966)-N(2))-methyltransferase RsmD [Bdellovibrionota bacterium]
MRIIGGRFKGRRLKSPKGMTVRPMLDQIREALFNILGDEIVGREVIDCFAGTGAIGLEALSRGAKGVTFFERNSNTASILKKNIELCGVKDEGKLIVGHLPSSLKRLSKKVEIAFLDPPFDDPIGVKTLLQLGSSPQLLNGALVVFRHSIDYPMENFYPPLHRIDHRIYGRSQLSFYRKEES